MARTALTVQEIGISGAQMTYAAANVDGHSVPAGNAGDLWLEIKNGGGASITVTIPSTGKKNGVDVEDVTVSLPAGENRHITNLSAGVSAQTDGTIHINYSSVTSVTVAAFRQS